MAKKAAKTKSKSAGLGNEGPPGGIFKSEAVRKAKDTQRKSYSRDWIE
jgi:hypothetical protein